MTFHDIKAKSRRDVHRTFAVPCVLTTVDGTFSCTARLHGRMVLGGDIAGEGYATIVEGVSRVVFNREELAVLNAGTAVAPVRGDRVVFSDYFAVGQPAILELDARDAFEGPIDEKWAVTQYLRQTPVTATMAGTGAMTGESA